MRVAASGSTPADSNTAVPSPAGDPEGPGGRWPSRSHTRLILGLPATFAALRVAVLAALVALVWWLI